MAAHPIGWGEKLIFNENLSFSLTYGKFYDHFIII